MLQQRVYTLEVEKSNLEQAILQRDEQIMQIKGPIGSQFRGSSLIFYCS